MNLTIGSPLVGMKFADIQKRYNSDDLAQDLSGGFRDILAGVGGDYLLTVDSVNGFITLADKNVVYGTDGDGISAGAMASGKNAPAIALTAAGIAMGYNRPSDGHWVNAVTIESDGNAAFSGTIRASEIIAGTVIAGGVTIAGADGDKTLDQIIAGTGYTAEQLQTDLAAGVGNIVAGVGSDYQMLVDTTNNYIAIGQVGAVFKGSAVPGINRPTIGLSAAGLAMGYNRASDGAWVDSVAIDASGNASFSGAINATSGSFVESVTVGGVPLSTIKSGAAAGATAVQPAALASALSTKLDNASATIMASGFYLKTLYYDSTEANKGGLAIFNGGLIARRRNAGNTGWENTVAIGTDGNITVKGDISGSTGTFAGTVSASNLTAGTISAAVSINTGGFVRAQGDTTGYGSSRGAIIGESLTTGYSAIYGISNGPFKYTVIGENISTAAGGVRGSGYTGVFGQTLVNGGYGVYGDANGSAGVAGVYSSGKFGTNSNALVANLNAQYLNSKQSSDFALWTGAAPVAGTVTSNYTIPMVIAGYNVRVLVAYP